MFEDNVSLFVYQFLSSRYSFVLKTIIIEGRLESLVTVGFYAPFNEGLQKYRLGYSFKEIFLIL